MEVTKKNFGATADGKNVEIFELKNQAGTVAKVITYGARLQSWLFKNVNVVLGYDTVAEYEADDSYKGAIVGRCANRIGGAKFVLNGKTYNLDKNDAGKNHLHGGFNGTEKKIWSAESVGEGLKLFTEIPDGEGGYPGNLKIEVIYNLTDDNKLEISYKAISDADTLCNFTNHSYFNLDGGGDILNHKIKIFADSYTWANSESVPDGRILSVEGTPMDLRTLKRIGAHIDDDFDELNFGRGYDHNYCLGKLGEMKKAAYVESSDAAIKLTVETEMPGIQFYAGNWLNDKKFGKRTGFALESQYYPNAINLPNFDQPILKAGEVWTSKTIYSLY